MFFASQSYTQYIPLSLYDLQTWMGHPSIYVFDCSNAGVVAESFKAFAKQMEHDQQDVSDSFQQLWPVFLSSKYLGGIIRR